MKLSGTTLFLTLPCICKSFTNSWYIEVSHHTGDHTMLQVPYTRTEVMNFTHNINDVGLLWQNFKTVHESELDTWIKTTPGDKEISDALLIRVQRRKQGKEDRERLYRRRS